MTHLQKRIKIILVYLLLFLVLGGVIYFMAKPEMTCNDGIKNQGEEKVDCGGPCGACQKNIEVNKLQVRSVEMVDASNGTQDVVIKIYNSDEKYGAENFNFIIEDNLGNKSSVYNSFILPKEEKYIVINDYVLMDNAQTIKVSINNEDIQWQRAIEYRDPRLIIYNKSYELATSGNVYSKIVGLLVNKSMVDYETIKVKGILRDKNGKLLGASYQIMYTLPAGTKRNFIIQFPFDFESEVESIEVQSETNIFKTDNYLQTEGRGNLLDR